MWYKLNLEIGSYMLMLWWKFGEFSEEDWRHCSFIWDLDSAQEACPQFSEKVV